MAAETPKSDLLQGTLDMLILKVVALGPIHGYAIAQRLQQMSGDGAPGAAGIAVSGAASAREAPLAARANGPLPTPDARRGSTR